MTELSQKDLDRIMGELPGCIALYQVDGANLHTIRYSSSIPEISGYTDKEYSELVTRNATDIILESDRGGTVQTISDCVKDCTKQVTCVYRVLHKTKSFAWIYAQAKCIGTLEGKPLILSNFLNISIEAEMHAELLSLTHRKIYVCDAKTLELLFVNDTALEGKSDRNYNGKTCYQFIRNRADFCPSCVTTRMIGETSHEEDWRDPYTDRYYHVESKRLSWFGRDAYAHVIEDITESKKSQLNAEARNAELEKIVSNIPAGLCVYRVKGKNDLSYVTTNAALRDIAGISEEEFQTSSQPILAERLHPDDKQTFTDALHKLQVASQTTSCTFRLRRNEHERYRYLRLEGRSVKEPDGSLLAFACFTDVSLQSEATQALQVSEMRYKLAIKGANLLVWEYDVPGNRIISSDRSLEEVGYPNVIENVPQTILPDVDPNDQEKFLALYADVHAGKASSSCEVWMTNKKTNFPQCQRITYYTVCDLSGRPIRAYGLSQVITTQKLEEIKYRKSVQDLFTANPQAMASFRLNLTRNEILESHTPIEHYRQPMKGGIQKLTADGLFDKVVCDMPSEEERSRFMTTFSRKNLLNSFREGKATLTCEYRRRIPTGSLRWALCTITLIANPESGDTECFIYTSDITDRKREEAVIQRVTNEEYDFIAILDVDTRLFTFRNIRSDFDDIPQTKTFPYDEGARKLLNADIYSGVSASHKEMLTFDSIIKNLKKASSYTVTLQRKSKITGEIVRKQLKYSYLNEGSNEILVIETDITEINRQEQERAQKMQAALDAAEKANEAKSDFLSNISHDMRTPLNGIIGFTDLAIKEDNFEKAKEHLAKIKLSGKLLLDLINDTLDLSKIESGKITLRPTILNTDSLIESLTEIISASAEGKHQKFIIDKDPQVAPYIRMDRLCLQKIFLNLLSNAIKFTPEGGTIEFRIKKLFTPIHGANCLLTVRDTGIGIGEKFLPKIFDAFAQEQAPESGNVQGTGLGLAIAKKLVNLMGGTIEVESEKGKGTLFSVYLYIDPVRDYSPTSGLDQKNGIISLQGKKILLVEDHPLNTELAKMILEQKGISVKTAGNGEEAVKQFSESEPEFFDAILMDIRMPVMDGLAATRCIRGLPREDARTVPIIAMTANAFDDDVRHCLEAGMNFHIAKPINPEELFSALSKFIKDNVK